MPADNHNNEIIYEKERVMIERVLQKYNISVEKIFRIRSVYKVQSSAGAICVKRMKHGRNKAKNGYFLVEELTKSGFYSTAKYFKTTSGNYCVKYGKYIFYVTEWIDGNECEIVNTKDAENCVELLAKFHIAVNTIDTKELRVKNNLKNWPKIFSKDLSDLEKFKIYIKNKKIRNHFDNLYFDYIDIYYSRAVIALAVLNNSDYYRLSKEANQHKSICHDSFYYQNIIKKNEEYYLIDLDSILIDLQIIDLGKFIRRVVSKKHCRWEFNVAKDIITAYSKIKHISKEDLDIILALLIFPHRFWKLGKKRYIKQKNWSEIKYIKKLNKIIKYYFEEQKFIEDFMNFINEYDTNKT